MEVATVAATDFDMDMTYKALELMAEDLVVHKEKEGARTVGTMAVMAEARLARNNLGQTLGILNYSKPGNPATCSETFLTKLRFSDQQEGIE